MTAVTETAAALTVLGQARNILHELQQSKLSEAHRALVSQALEIVNDGQDRLSRLVARNIELTEQNQALRNELRDIEDWNVRLAEHEHVTAPGGAIVLRPKEATLQCYVCPRCAESDHQIHILQPTNNMAGEYECPGCQRTFPVAKPPPWPM